MESSNHFKAKIFTLIPIYIFLITIVCLIIGTILEKPTNRGTIYSFLILIVIINIFLAPLPCFILSILGIIFSIKALTEGIVQSRKFLVLGIFESLGGVLAIILAILMIIGGMSV